LLLIIHTFELTRTE